MATAPNSSSFQYLHRPLPLLRRLSPSTQFLPPATTTTSAATSASLSSATCALSSSSAAAAAAFTPSPAQPQNASLDPLLCHLDARNFRQADEETRRLLLELAGEPAQKRGYVFFSEVKFIPEPDLAAIDELWRRHSGGRFGYAVQRKVWEREGRDFTRFFIRVGWMKRLEAPDSEEQVVQYNYRAFPEEFRWELNEDTPEGHLPLTNCLRGTQLLSSILTHPAFTGKSEDDGDGDGVVNGGEGGIVNKQLRDNRMQPLVLKPSDYSF